ncbi:MAG: patatin-like phospholipase family protein [Polyangiales bacterium]
MHAILYVGSDLAPILALGTSRRIGEGEVQLTRPGAEPLDFILERDTSRALRWLTARPIDVVIVDARVATGVPRADARAMLDKLFPSTEESHGLGPRERTLVLVDADAEGSRVAYEAGRHRVLPPLVGEAPSVVLEQVDALVTSRGRGRIALCLAGGGIEGLLYELGVLRAIDRFMLDRRLCDVDLFFGISAGSILSAFMANGVSADEIADGLRRGNDRVPRITRGDLFDPNIGELTKRAWGLTRELVGRGEARNALSGLYRAIPSGVFAGDRLRGYIQRVLNKRGMSDSFEETRRPLFVGATDQDTAEAVVFGEPGWMDVPIHKAVRASCALAPFYTPERIGGRWYIDGAFTRTTNMRVAVRHGATLALLVDPLVPIYSTNPGYVHQRGGLFGAMQGLKALINGRFDKAAVTIAEMFPNVSFHLFRPEGDEMRVLSGSPMKFLYREEIEQLAYESTVRKLRSMLPRLQRDFARHGVRFQEPVHVPGADPYVDGILAVA